jgi:aldehyde dehydrogenase (NAD+)
MNADSWTAPLPESPSVSAPTTLANLVGGVWTDDGDGTIAVGDPADLDAVVAHIPAMRAADIDHVYDAAARGAREWAAAGALERGAVLLRAAELLRARRETIATDLVREMGKTLAEATVEVTKAADFFAYYGAMGRSPVGVLLADARPGVEVSVRTEPVGVVLAITPWNDPLLTPARKLAPALFAGNAVVLKPATQTPIVALHLARALDDAGLPAGVLNTVTGRGAEISPALLGDRRLTAVTFTGSNAVGQSLRDTLGSTAVRLQTELGGKNATAVLADADVEKAAATIAAAAFAQAGQRCTATSRVVVQRPVADALVSALVARAGTLRLGSGLDPQTTMGPVVGPGQQAEILDYVAGALSEGARAVTGGAERPDGALANGCFVAPTVLVDVDPAMTIWREEVFGPVVAIVVADDFDAIMDAVNDSIYGLSAAVFTRDLAAARAFAARADTGQVSVNLPTSGWDVHHPFGGFRASGSAFKEQGTEGLQFYTRVKTIAIGA